MTTIEWTDETWNPTTGCDRISPGCDNRYALTLAKRLKGSSWPRLFGSNADNVLLCWACQLDYRDQGTAYAATLARCTAHLPLTEDCGVDRDST